MKIILFDGFCNLCCFSVQFIIKRDSESQFKFAPIQSIIGQELISQFKISSLKVDTIIYFKDDKYFLRSSAVLNILRDIGGGWKLLYGFMIVPKFFRDFLYQMIAKTRYRLFGKKEICMIPDEIDRNRFLF